MMSLTKVLHGASVLGASMHSDTMHDATMHSAVMHILGCSSVLKAAAVSAVVYCCVETLLLINWTQQWQGPLLLINPLVY